MNEFVAKHSLVLFFVLTIPLAWFWWVQMYLGLWPTELVLVPSSLGGASPILTLLVLDRLSKGAVGVNGIFSSVHTWKQRIPWLVIAAFSYPVMITIGNTASFVLGYETQLNLLNPGPGTLGTALIAIVPITFFAMLLSSPLLEEPGWRGFALPKLQAMFGREIGSLIIGSYWWLWHQMMDVSFGGYPSLLGYLSQLGLSFMTDSLFNLSRRNLLAAMFVHSSSFIALTYLYSSADVMSGLVSLAAIWALVAVLRLLERQRGLPRALESGISV